MKFISISYTAILALLAVQVAAAPGPGPDDPKGSDVGDPPGLYGQC